jgi:glycosyltransferase involved in cell wall biosynthesis
MGRELEALGHMVDVVTLDDPNEAYIKEFPLRVFATGPSVGGYGFTKKLVPWLKGHVSEYDAVVVNGLWRYHAFGTWRAIHGSGVPYYAYPHGMLDPWFKSTYPLKHLKKWLYWPWADYRVLRDARAVLFTSEEERLGSRQSFWLYRARECEVAFGTSAPPSDGPRLKELFLTANPALRGRRILLFLGRIHVKKGCDLLIRAFAGVCQREPALHLLMAGPDPTGWMPALKGLATQLGVADRISWPGLLQDEMKWGAFYAAEAFTLPSHQENFGIAAAEALGCGIPVLISNKVNIWREIEKARAGLVDADTEEATRSVLRRWLDLSADQRAQMGERARELYGSRFTARAMAQGLVSVIENTTHEIAP